MFNQNIAIDLGTANTIVIYNDKIVLDEPSVIAINQHTEKVEAVGKRALEMIGRTPSYIHTVRPLEDGVIADFEAAELMLATFIRDAIHKKFFFKPSFNMVICIPSCITNVEERAVRETAEQIGARTVKLIHEPMAAAVGSGLDVLSPYGNMIVDIGGGTSEIAVISLGGITNSKSIKIGGTKLTLEIQNYIRKKHNIAIGESTAEEIKIHIGSAISDLENPPADMEISGLNLLEGIPSSININYLEIVEALNNSISQIENAVIDALSSTPPELASDIYKTGIFLSGGGALLRGLDIRLNRKTKLKIHIAEDPLKAVARGSAIALKNIDRFPFLLKG